MKFKEMELAHQYCTGRGVEIGPAAHNPFGLKDCLFLAHTDRIEFWRESEKNMCGEYIQPDMFGNAEDIPVEDNSLDYVLSSHVIEHVPDPIRAFIEWDRVLKPGGIVFMIFPKRDADPGDVNRPVSEIDAFFSQYENPQPLNDHDRHIWIFTLQSMIELIEKTCLTCNLKWEIIETEETDSKVGNGHTIIARKSL